MVTPAGSDTKGGVARRERLLRDLPAALQKEEARIFAAAKRLDASGDRLKADLLFELSRKAFHALQEIERSRRSAEGLDDALERGNQMLFRLGGVGTP